MPLPAFFFVFLGFFGVGSNLVPFFTAHSISMTLFHASCADKRKGTKKRQNYGFDPDIIQRKTCTTKNIHLSFNLMLSGTYVSALRYRSSATWRSPLSTWSVIGTRGNGWEMLWTVWIRTFRSEREQASRMHVRSSCVRRGKARLRAEVP
jgi:hypothetical protein